MEMNNANDNLFPRVILKASTREIMFFKLPKYFLAQRNVLCTFYVVFDHLIE